METHIITAYFGFSPTTRQTSPCVTIGLEKECNEKSFLSLMDAIKEVENTENYKIYISKAWIRNGEPVKIRDFCIDGEKLKNIFNARWLAYNTDLGD